MVEEQMATIQQAAERLAAFYAGRNPYTEEMYLEGIDADKDQRAFCRALTDPRPLDEAALRELGFEQIDEAPEGMTALGCLQTYPEYKNREGDRRWFVDSGHGFTSIPKRLKPKTVGELRMLLLKLESGSQCKK